MSDLTVGTAFSGGLANAAEVAPEAIISAAEAGLVNGLDQNRGDVTLRSSFNKDIKSAPPPKESGGGFLGIFKAILKPIASVLSFIPGIGQIASFVINFVTEALSNVLTALKTGKLDMKELMSSITSVATSLIPGGGLAGLAGKGGLGALAGMFQSGKIGAGGIASAFTGLLQGLPGGGLERQALEAGFGLIADGVTKGRIDGGVLAKAIAPVLGAGGDLGGDVAARTLGGLVDAGNVPVKEALDALEPLIALVTDDAAGRDVLKGLLGTAGEAIGDGSLSARNVVRSVTDGVKDLF